VDLQRALARMNAVGILMRARGDRLWVESRAPLTDQQRAWIRAHMADLLRLLAVAVPTRPKRGDEAQKVIAKVTGARAAMRQASGEEPRGATEREVQSVMRVHRYRLIDNTDTWLTMIAPNCDLQAARRCLSGHFGERLTAVAEHVPQRQSR